MTRDRKSIDKVSTRVVGGKWVLDECRVAKNICFVTQVVTECCN